MEEGKHLLVSRPPGLLRRIIGWILCIFTTLVFIIAGGIKLRSRPNMVQEFNQIGLGQWFRYFTGILEVSGAIGVLIPRLSRWAALLLAAVMVGAIVANLTVLHMPPTLPFGLLILTITLAWLRS